MARSKKNTPADSLHALQEFALEYPQAQMGIACEGTALQKITIRAGSKSFLFLGLADMMLKLGSSLPDAVALAAEHPDMYKVGANGWVTAKFHDDAMPPLDLLKRWVDESYRLVAGRKLVAMLPG